MRLYREFHAPIPASPREREKPLDKVKEPPRASRSLEPVSYTHLTEGLFLMDGIEGLRSLTRHSVDMLLTDPPYGLSLIHISAAPMCW